MSTFANRRLAYSGTGIGTSGDPTDTGTSKDYSNDDDITRYPHHPEEQGTSGAGTGTELDAGNGLDWADVGEMLEPGRNPTGLTGQLFQADELRAKGRAVRERMAKEESDKKDTIVTDSESEPQDEYTFQGLPLVIENPAGSVRKWQDKDGGESGATKMHYDYGFIDGYTGSDDEEVDVYVGPNEDSKKVFVVDQMKKPDFKEYDEQKVMMGFDSADEAKAAYLKQYDDPGFFGKMTELSLDEFKHKLKKLDDNDGKIARRGGMKTQANSEGAEPQMDAGTDKTLASPETQALSDEKKPHPTKNARFADPAEFLVEAAGEPDVGHEREDFKEGEKVTQVSTGREGKISVLSGHLATVEFNDELNPNIANVWVTDLQKQSKTAAGFGPKWQEFPVQKLLDTPPTWVRSIIQQDPAAKQDWENAVHFAAEHSKQPGETANLGHALQSFKDLGWMPKPKGGAKDKLREAFKAMAASDREPGELLSRPLLAELEKYFDQYVDNKHDEVLAYLRRERAGDFDDFARKMAKRGQHVEFVDMSYLLKHSDFRETVKDGFWNEWLLRLASERNDTHGLPENVVRRVLIELEDDAKADALSQEGEANKGLLEHEEDRRRRSTEEETPEKVAALETEPPLAGELPMVGESVADAGGVCPGCNQPLSPEDGDPGVGLTCPHCGEYVYDMQQDPMFLMDQYHADHMNETGDGLFDEEHEPTEGEKLGAKFDEALGFTVHATVEEPAFGRIGVEKEASEDLPFDLFGDEPGGGYTQAERNISTISVNNLMEERPRMLADRMTLVREATKAFSTAMKGLKAGYTIESTSLSKIAADRLSEQDGSMLTGCLTWQVILASHSHRRRASVTLLMPVIAGKPQSDVKVVTAGGKEIAFSKQALDELMTIRDNRRGGKGYSRVPQSFIREQ